MHDLNVYRLADASDQTAIDANRIELAITLQLGQTFFLREFATAVVGSVIGINPFD